MKTNRRAKSLRKSALYAAISLCTLQAGLLTPAFAEDENKLTFSGDVRAGWLEYDYGNPQGIPTINKGHKDSKGFYIVPKLSLTTARYSGFSGKVTIAGATDFGINNPDEASRLFV